MGVQSNSNKVHASVAISAANTMRSNAATHANSNVLQQRLWFAYFAIGSMIFAGAQPGLAVSVILIAIMSLAHVLYVVSMPTAMIAQRADRMGGGDVRCALEGIAGSFLMANMLWAAIVGIEAASGGALPGAIFTSIIAFAIWPILTIIEGMVSGFLVYSLGQSSEDFGQQLRIVTLIDAKYGGNLGSINR